MITKLLLSVTMNWNKKNMMLIIMAVVFLSKENDNYDDGSDDIGKNESCRESAPPFLNSNHSLNILSFSFQLSVFWEDQSSISQEHCGASDRHHQAGEGELKDLQTTLVLNNFRWRLSPGDLFCAITAAGTSSWSHSLNFRLFLILFSRRCTLFMHSSWTVCMLKMERRFFLCV